MRRGRLTVWVQTISLVLYFKFKVLKSCASENVPVGVSRNKYSFKQSSFSKNFSRSQVRIFHSRLQSEDIRLLKEELIQGEQNLDRVSRLRDECVALAWAKDPDTKNKKYGQFP